ncbi:MAG: TRAP transporter small permease subunit [Dehalococcoidales bacterium]|nr:TRAP transporter small permease subunit [Dehalococcoidales bacterium]
MPKAAITYVRCIDSMSRAVGKIVKFIVIALLAVLLIEAVSRAGFNTPLQWSVEMGEYIMTTFYILGGGYVLLTEGHVRMDVLYHRWSAKRKATADAITFSLLAVFLVVLMLGGIESSLYAWEYKQVSRTPWGPYLYPIKFIMTTGIILMLLQAISSFIKDLAAARGKAIT